MKENYQGYIESENFGQSRSFVAFNMATEHWSAYRRVSIIAVNWIFSPKRLNQNLETRAWNEEKPPRIHWIRKFLPNFRLLSAKFAIEEPSVYQARVNNRYKLIFFSKTA